MQRVYCRVWGLGVKISRSDWSVTNSGVRTSIESPAVSSLQNHRFPLAEAEGRAHTASRLEGPVAMRRRRAFLAPLAALAIFAAIVSVARADVHAPVGFGRGQTFLLSARRVFDAEAGGDDARVETRRRLVENDPRYGAAVRRVLLEGARDGPSEGGGEGAGTRDESGPPRHGADTPKRRDGVGVARLARRAVDAEEELAAEANGTKPRLTSPRPGPRGGLGASAKRASTTTRDAGDDRPKIPTTNGPERKNLDPRWRLLFDDDDDDDDVWSNPGDLGADATASSSSQLLVVTDGRAGVAAQLADALATNGGALGEIVPALSWTAIGGPRAANAASAVPGVTWVGPVRPEDAIARAWDPLFEAIALGDRARVDDAIPRIRRRIRRRADRRAGLPSVSRHPRRHPRRHSRRHPRRHARDRGRPRRADTGRIRERVGRPARVGVGVGGQKVCLGFVRRRRRASRGGVARVPPRRAPRRPRAPRKSRKVFEGVHPAFLR